jgi:hypothetical protein
VARLPTPSDRDRGEYNTFMSRAGREFCLYICIGARAIGANKALDSAAA